MQVIGSGIDRPDALADLLRSSTPKAVVARILRETLAMLVRDKAWRATAVAGGEIPVEAFVDERRRAELQAAREATAESLARASRTSAEHRALLVERAEFAEKALERLREARLIAKDRLGTASDAVLSALAVPPLSPTGARRALSEFEKANPGWATDEVPAYGLELAAFLSESLKGVDEQLAGVDAAAASLREEYVRRAALAKQLEAEAEAEGD